MKETIKLAKQEKNKIVCMLAYSVTDNQAKLNHIYTPVKKKGYTANLINLISNKLFEKGLVPKL
jgi:hypothetical protein